MSEFDPSKTVQRYFWAYEHRGHYKHSYMVMQTTDKTHFVVEKNDLGVIWQAPYQTKEETVKTIRDKKVEHDGSRGTRESVNLHKQWVKGKNDVPVTIGELKKLSRAEVDYSLMSANCHHFARLIFQTLTKQLSDQVHGTGDTYTLDNSLNSFKKYYRQDDYDFWELWSFLAPNDFLQSPKL